MKEQKPQELTDLQTVLGWKKHIEEPCEYQGNNLQNDYIIEAKKLLRENKLKDPVAIKMLEDVIKEYEQPLA